MWKPDEIPCSVLRMSSLRSFAQLGSSMSGPCVVVLCGSVTADATFLLAGAIILAAMMTPEKRSWHFHVNDKPPLLDIQEELLGWTHLHPGACWLSDTGAPSESVTTACPWLWMDIPGICCHVEGMRICCVPVGQPCCTVTHVKTEDRFKLQSPRVEQKSQRVF